MKSQYPGVYAAPNSIGCQKWRAIVYDSTTQKQIHIGVFLTESDAAKAARKAQAAMDARNKIIEEGTIVARFKKLESADRVLKINEGVKQDK